MKCPAFRTYHIGAPREWGWSSSPDGRTYRVSSHPFLDTDGSVLVLELGVDITGLKRSEDALKESLAQQRAILDTIPDMAWLKDKESRFVMVNEQFGRACGASPEQLTGRTGVQFKAVGYCLRLCSTDVNELGAPPMRGGASHSQGR